MSSRTTQTSPPSPALLAGLSAHASTTPDLSVRVRQGAARDHAAADPARVRRREADAARLSRLVEADAQWLAEVAEAGFQGPVFDEGADRLVLAAVAKVKGRLLSGEILRASAKAGRPVVAADAGLRQLRACPADLDALAWDVVERAWGLFTERALVGGRWNPEGGATLAGYLQAFCTRELKNAYMKWLPRFLRRDDVLADPVDLSELLARDRSPTGSGGPEPFVLDADAQALLDHLALPQQQALVLVALGYQKNEAAAILGIGPKALAARLAKAKKILQQHYPDGRSR